MKKNETDLVIIGAGIVGIFTAYNALKKGLKVKLVDIGSLNDKNIICSEPTLICKRKYHESSYKARNQVIGGNSTFWGGGLIRPPFESVKECIEFQNIENKLKYEKTKDLDFEKLDRILGINTNPDRKVDFVLGEDSNKIIETNIFILNGKKRNIVKPWLDFCLKNTNCEIHSSAKIIGFNSISESDNNMVCKSLVIEESKKILEIYSNNFLLCSGAIDTNLIVRTFCNDLSLKIDPNKLGKYLHDHWSLPIAEIKNLNKNFAQIIKPKFSKKASLRKHYEFESVEKKFVGFFHFSFNFKELYPYKNIQELLNLRQINFNLFIFIKLFGNIKLMYKILILLFYKQIKKELFFFKGLTATLNVDFESFPHPNNYIDFKDRKIYFNWDLYKEDEKRFLYLIEPIKKLIERIETLNKSKVKTLFDINSRNKALEYFRSNVADAYRLGGGLSIDGKTIVNNNLKLIGNSNFFIISSAIFERSGVINPTYLLLSLSNKFLENIKK